MLIPPNICPTLASLLYAKRYDTAREWIAGFPPAVKEDKDVKQINSTCDAAGAISVSTYAMVSTKIEHCAIR